ncbi:MAG TPA: outer membrane protein assembly factor BamD [Mariprofundaceae bacterium]|nr:outer membrane protein assembly factor BamD [Mariprofundaceae bacterium]
MQLSRFPRWLTYAAVILALGACAKRDFKMTTPEADYEKAKKMVMEQKDYNTAAYFLEKFASEHPYSHYTTQAELLRAYAAYKGDELPLAETICEEFIRRHPRHPDVAYAEYLLAMTYYQETSKPERDQTMTTKAIDAFERVIAEHPGTVYAKDAASHLQQLYNNLASHEVTVGKFYFDRKQYVAAANRFQTVIHSYQTTPSIEEALYYLAASYAALGLKDDARQTSILLRSNYPRGKWSAKAKAFL